MIKFDAKCPKNYPQKCNLLDVEKAALVRSELYKVFFMYQFAGQQDYLVETINRYFTTPTYYLHDAQEEAGLGIKICKICRLALASDFGIASLTPLNYNVFFEIGLMLGLGKPVVYLVDKNFKSNGYSGARAIPFDLSDQLVIEHETKEELTRKMEKEAPIFATKVELSSVYEKELVQFITNKIETLDDDRKKLLKFFVLEQGQDLHEGWLNTYLEKAKITIKCDLKAALLDLEKLGFIRRGKSARVFGQASHATCSLEENYKYILRNLLFNITMPIYHDK